MSVEADDAFLREGVAKNKLGQTRVFGAFPP